MLGMVEGVGVCPEVGSSRGCFGLFQVVEATAEASR